MSMYLSQSSAGILALPVPATGDFTSDSVIHADLGTTLGLTPNVYANYQMIRTIAKHINLNTDMSFDVDRATTLIYAHPTLNEHDTFGPSWLGTLTNTGLKGVISMPDPLTALGMQDVSVEYYQLAFGPGKFTHAGWRSANFDEKLAHYVGCWLIAPDVVVTNIEPECYPLISDISVPYVAPAMDEFMWALPPTASGTPTSVETNWNNAHLALEAANPGDRIQLQNGTHTDGGDYVVTGATGTLENPIIFEPETLGSVTLNDICKYHFVNCHFLIIQGFIHTGDTYDGGSNYPRPWEINNDCTWLSFRNDKYVLVGSVLRTDFVFVNEGKYITIGHSDFDDHKGRWQSIQHTPDSTKAYCRVHHNDFFNRFPYASNQGQDGQSGQGDTVADQIIELNDMWDHNRHAGWDNTTESEIIGQKSRGSIFANNVFDDQRGVVSTRVPYGGLMFANRFFNVPNKYNRNCVRNIGGQFGDVSEMCHALNWCDYFSDPNGFWQVIRATTATVNRNAANGTLIVADMVLDGNDEAHTHRTFGAAPYTLPQNVKLEACACELSAAPVFDDSPFPLQASEAFSSCVLHGTSVGDIGLPAGVTFEDPVFTPRAGDGVPVPTHADLFVDRINTCMPGWLETKIIPNVGANYV